MNHIISRRLCVVGLALGSIAGAAPAQTFFGIRARDFNSGRETPHPGERYQVSMKIDNNGSLTHLRDVRVGIFLSPDSRITANDALLHEFPPQSLRPFETRLLVREIRIPENWPAGPARIGVFADFDDRVSELNESDNISSEAITVRGVADLRVSNAVIRTATPAAGAELSVEFTVENRGNVPAGNRFLGVTGVFLGTGATHQASDLFLGSAPMLVGPGESVTRKLQRALPAHLNGNLRLHVVTDYEDKVEEYDETNNERRLDVTIQPIARTARRVELLPRLGSIANSTTTGTITASRGGSADMLVVAPEFAFGDYLCVWSCSPTFVYDTCTEVSFGLLNGPVMPRWFGRLDNSGRAFPAIALPPIPRVGLTVYTHALFRSLDGSRIDLATRPIRLSILAL